MEERARSWAASVEHEVLRLGVRTTDWRRFNPTAISAAMQARAIRKEIQVRNSSSRAGRMTKRDPAFGHPPLMVTGATA